MECITLDWLKNLLIWIVVLCALVAVVRLLLPLVLGLFGAQPDGGVILRIINIAMWAIVLIAVIIFLFDLFGCFIGSSSGSHLRLRG
jgi:uncharacterized membrane protein